MDALGFVWDALAERWEEGFRALQGFKTEYGHCRVPAGHITISGYQLGRWVLQQRTGKVAGNLSTALENRLNGIDFVWDPFAVQWERGFRALQGFKIEHGHCRAPRGYVTVGNFDLGRWVSKQRTTKAAGTLLAEREKRLNDIGFVWVAR